MQQEADDDPDDLNPRLRKYRAPTLTERLILRVDNLAESDPNECGGLVVSMDPSAIEIHFDGDSSLRWTGSWTEFRWLLGRIRGEQVEAVREAGIVDRLKKQADQRKDATVRKQQREWRGMLSRRKTAASPSPDGATQ